MALLEVQEWSGGSAGGLGVVGWSSRRFRSGWEALPKVREALPDIRKWLGDPHGGPGVVERPSLRSVSFWEAFPEAREWSGGLPEGLGVVG